MKNYPRFYKQDKNMVIGPFDGGIVIDAPRNEIKDSQSPDMLNMIFENGIITKREGQKILFDSGGSHMNACFSKEFNGYIIYHAKTRIKAYRLSDGEITVFDRYISDKKGEFFEYNGRIYYIGIGEYYRISFENDFLTLENVEGYIPLRYINCDVNTGTGDDNEKPNFLTPRYRASYNTVKDFNILVLPPNTSGSDIIMEYNNRVIPPDNYHYEDGKIFIDGEIEMKDGHNNLILTLTDRNAQNDREKITNCTAVCRFGGSSSGFSEGTRVFLGGNEKYANTYFRSELKNPEYFPIDAYDILGDTLDPIVGFGRQGGGLVVFKKNSLYYLNYEYSGTDVVFTVTNISPDIGCDMKNTIQTADNRLIWFNSNYGVMMLSSTYKNNEKNIQIISHNINGSGSEKALLKEENIDAAAFTYKNRYHLCRGDYCYVLDYGNGAYYSDPSCLKWYLYKNVNMSFSVQGENRLYICKDKERFTYFAPCLYDFNEDNPISSYYVTKAYDMGRSGVFKIIKDISFIIRADNNSFAKVSCYDEDGKIKEFEGYSIKKFSFGNFKFSGFTFRDSSFAVFVKRKIKRNRVKFFSVKLENSEILSDMAISEISVTYQTERGVKQNGI